MHQVKLTFTLNMTTFTTLLCTAAYLCAFVYLQKAIALTSFQTLQSVLWTASWVVLVCIDTLSTAKHHRHWSHFVRCQVMPISEGLLQCIHSEICNQSDTKRYSRCFRAVMSPSLPPRVRPGSKVRLVSCSNCLSASRSTSSLKGAVAICNDSNLHIDLVVQIVQ